MGLVCFGFNIEVFSRGLTFNTRRADSSVHSVGVQTLKQKPIADTGRFSQTPNYLQQRFVRHFVLPRQTTTADVFRKSPEGHINVHVMAKKEGKII